MYELIIKPLAEREFKKLSQELKKKFYEEFKKLSINPFATPNLKKIRGTKYGWRLRIGRWAFYFLYLIKKKELRLLIYF
jgi:mRNA-degrading endonuclease RelE of RelBE toxin-antitoxin system